MKRTLVLTVALLLLIVVPADARERMTFDYARLVAVDYWAKHGVVVPCEPTFRILTTAQMAAYNVQDGVEAEMRADRSHCQVLIGPDGAVLQDFMGWKYCETIVHEIGHLAGLRHPDYPGLAAEQRAFLNSTVMGPKWGLTPFGCAHPRQWKVKQGWRKPPRWVRRSPKRVQRLWLSGQTWKARTALTAWLRSR